MKLHEYLTTNGKVTATQLAALIGIKSVDQVRQWQHGYGGRYPSPEYCLSIERATGGYVTRQDLRPHDFWKIWPDLSHLTPSAKEIV